MFNNRFDFKNKHFLVTGATSGIGYATSVLLMNLGCKITAVGRNTAKLQELEKIGNGNIVSISMDLRLAESSEKLVDAINLVDGFCHSAGVVKRVPLYFVGVKQLDEERSLNYDAFVFLVQALVKKRKIVNGGSIVSISSIAGHYGTIGATIYSGTKAALMGTSRVFARELAPKGIRVNTISPGIVRTEMIEVAKTSQFTEEALINDSGSYPLGFGCPTDVAYCVAFLFSDASRWLTGQDIVLDGGRTCYI
jgi:NAD(P)-dependent dehydrogenase (short-subunit alcohol dehydrogenase family)